jgi:hypothetical protein
MQAATVVTQQKYERIKHVIEHLRVRDKRNLYVLMRNFPNLSPSTLFPAYGFVAGEFAIGQILSDTTRTRNRSSNSSSLSSSLPSSQPFGQSSSFLASNTSTNRVVQN